MLSLEPGLAERFDSALDCVRAGVYSSHRPLKAIAAEIDTSVSTLSRKLAAHPDDPRHFTLADLEQYVRATGDTTPISWLVARYMQPAADRRQQALDQLAALAPMLSALIREANS